MPESGADIKVVQRMLGHKDATMTLNQYGHLFEDNLDVLTDAISSARQRALTNDSAVARSTEQGTSGELEPPADSTRLNADQ